MPSERPAPTPYPELDALLEDLVLRTSDILGSCFIGAYLQGSFALGDADLHSDCDFLIVLAHDPDPDHVRALAAVHSEIPTRPGHWSRHLEGSYPVAAELRRSDLPEAAWLYVDHGSREVVRDTHCNQPWVRWTLRERGITLAGPPPTDLVDVVPPDMLRSAARSSLPTLVDDIHAWMPESIAWGQRYLVTSACRGLFTATTAEVASKRQAVLWARDRVDARWSPLLDQVLADRSRGFDPHDPPRPGSLQQAHAFARHAADLAGSAP